MALFTIFTSSAIVDHVIFYYFPQQDFAKWLGLTMGMTMYGYG